MRYLVPLFFAAFLCSFQVVECQQFTWLDRVRMGWQSDLDNGQQVVRNPRTGTLFCVGWLNGTVMRSTDDGRTWRGTYTWLTSVTRKNAGVYVLSNGTIVYIGQTTYNLHLAATSTDDGRTWGRLVSDPAMVNDTFGFTPMYVPPDGIFITNALQQTFATVDGGRTWRTFRQAVLDTSIGLYEQVVIAPNIAAIRNKPTWLRMDLRTDTGWTSTSVPYACRKWVELSNGVIFGQMGSRNVWRDLRSADTAWQVISTVFDADHDTTYTVAPWELLRANDSVAYIADNNGLICKFSSTSRTLSLLHRVQRRADESLSTTTKPPQQDSTAFVRYIVSSNGGRVREEIWITIANATGRVREQRTKGWSTHISSYTNPLIYPNGPLSFIKDSLVLCVGQWPNRREYVRTTDLGVTWQYIEDMLIEDVDPAYLSILSSSALPSGERMLQTVGDVLLRATPDGYMAVTQYATTWGSNEIMMYYDLQEASVLVKKRMPQIVVDNGSTIVSRNYLLRIDPSTGATIDTVLPRRALFMRRFNSEMLAVGADSLWMSFDNTKEWVYVPAIPETPAGQKRPTISDVRRAVDGTIYCALRGYYRRNTQGEESVYAAGGMSISTDDGNTWSMSAGWPERFDHVTTVYTLRNGDVLACAQDVVFDSLKNVGATSRFKGNEMLRAVILRSTDRGRTWNVVYTDYAAGIVYPTFDPDLVELPDGRVIATTFNGNVLESRTNGRTWNTYDIPELGTALVNTINVESDHSLIFNTTAGVGRFIVPATSVAEERTSATVTARITPTGMLIVNATTHIDHVTLATVDGRALLETSTSTSSCTTDVSSLPTGVYFVTVSWQGGMVARTLVMRP